MEPETKAVQVASGFVVTPNESALGKSRVVSLHPRAGLGALRSLRGWREPVLLALLLASVLGLTLSVVRSSVMVYLPPDGGHYIADADALLGHGVRALRHPPLFPALVAAARPVAGEANGFHVAMACSLGLLVAGLYTLVRHWTGPGASLLAAAAGALMPSTAEVLGWGGGATLLATAFLVFSLAAMETWIARGGRRGLLVGGALGLTALTHPFVFAIASICVAGRWALLVRERRRLSWGWDPLGLAGVASAAALCVPALLIAAPYYLGMEGAGGFEFKAPSLTGLSWLLGWSLGDNPLPWLLLVVGVLGAVLLGGPGQVAYAGSIAAVVLLMAMSLGADRSYVSRAAYLFPVPVAIGVGAAVDHVPRFLDRFLAWFPRRRVVAAGAAIAMVGSLALSSYAPRLQGAARFYQLLEPQDLQALQALRGKAGVVATSWHDNRYGTGVSTSWFVEGLSKRRAFGPTGPWLSTVREQVVAGLDMQRFFAGTEGIENGALQLAAGPPGVRADPALQVWSDGFYFPVLYGNSLVNTYPVSFTGRSSRQVEGGIVTWTFLDTRGSPVIRETAWLDERVVVIRYELASEVPPGDWSLWFWPAYGVDWKGVREGPEVVQARQGLPDEDVEFRLTTHGAEVSYHPVESRFGVEAIEVRAQHASSVTVHVEIDNRAAPGRIVSFDEGGIVAKYGLSDVVVWKETGWRDRFDRNSCYVLRQETPRLLIYGVLRQSCRWRWEGPV